MPCQLINDYTVHLLSSIARELQAQLLPVRTFDSRELPALISSYFSQKLHNAQYTEQCILCIVQNHILISQSHSVHPTKYRVRDIPFFIERWITIIMIIIKPLRPPAFTYCQLRLMPPASTPQKELTLIRWIERKRNPFLIEYKWHMWWESWT